MLDDILDDLKVPVEGETAEIARYNLEIYEDSLRVGCVKRILKFWTNKVIFSIALILRGNDNNNFAKNMVALIFLLASVPKF